MSSELATVDRGGYLDISHAPTQVLAEAREAAKALQDVLANKPKKVVMNGEQYLEFEDWQTLGRFYGITPKEDGDPEFSDFGTIRGFKASAVALFRGEVISRATAYCLTDEEKWRSRPVYEWHYVCTDGTTQKDDPGKARIVWEERRDGKGNAPKKEKVLAGEEPVPLFQLASMAQTRACAKVMRQVLAWVVVMAGYKATPAEELDSHTTVVDAEVVPPSTPRSAAPAAPQAPRTTTKAPAAPPRPDGRLPRWNDPCPACGEVGAVIVSKKKAGTYHCWKGATPNGCGYDFTPGDADIHAEAATTRAANGYTPPGSDELQITDDDVPF